MWKAKLPVYVILLLLALVANGRGDTPLSEELSHDMEQLESHGEDVVDQEGLAQFVEEESGSGISPAVLPAVVGPVSPPGAPCDSNPCLNGGQCTNVGIGRFTCNCTGTGYTGRTCGQDVDECGLRPRPCQDVCVNTRGSFFCQCTDPQLSLGPDGRRCVAEGVDLYCGQNDMTIILPRSLLRGLDREHLRLLDPRCTAEGNATHYYLSTSLTGCKTKLKKKGEYFVYSNIVLEIPLRRNQIVTRVREAEIPFFCFYSRFGVVSSVGLKPRSKKIIFSSKAFGKFTITMDLFTNPRFRNPVSPDDFPVMVYIRERLYFRVHVDTEDKRLSILALNCFATPSQDRSSRPRYVVIRDGCAVDETLQFHQQPDNQTQLFSLEAFQYVSKHPYVFFHCRVKICNARNPFSRCARGCIKRARRSEETLPEAEEENVYPLAQGPFSPDRQKREIEADETLESDQSLQVAKSVTKRSSYQTPVVAALGVLISVCVIAMSYMAWRKKRGTVRQYQPIHIDASN